MAEQAKRGGKPGAAIDQDDIRMNALDSVQRVSRSGYGAREHKIVGLGEHLAQPLDDDRLRLTYKNGNTTQ